MNPRTRPPDTSATPAPPAWSACWVVLAYTFVLLLALQVHAPPTVPPADGASAALDPTEAGVVGDRDLLAGALTDFWQGPQAFRTTRTSCTGPVSGHIPNRLVPVIARTEAPGSESRNRIRRICEQPPYYATAPPRAL
jgi:hypothetical protein